MFGTVDHRVEIQPHGSPDWYNAIDTSGANGATSQVQIILSNLVLEWDMSTKMNKM